MLHFYKQLAWGSFPCSWPGIWEHIHQMPLKENGSNWQRCCGRLGKDLRCRSGMNPSSCILTCCHLQHTSSLCAMLPSEEPQAFFRSFERGICGSHFSIHLSGSYHEFHLIFPLRSKTILLLASWPLFLTITLNCLISGLTGPQKYCFH